MFPPAEYLSRVKPFSLLQGGELTELVSGMDVGFYKEGKTVFRRGEKTERLFFVREGKIGLFSEAGLEEIVEKDELLGIEALDVGWRPEFDGKALEDSVVFELESAAVGRLAERNAGFRGYIEGLNSKRFFQLVWSGTGGAEENLHKPVSLIVGRSPVFCPRGEMLINAIKLMVDQRVGSVIVVDQGMEPVGIVTHSDVLRHISRGYGVLDPVERAMSSPIVTVGSSASILDAYVKFVSCGINHLAIVEGVRLTGVISIKDLVSNLDVHSYFFKVTKGASGTTPVETVPPLKGMDGVIRNAAMRGLDYPSISAIVTRLADSAAKKAVSPWFGDPETRAALMFTGELGRGEFSFPLEADLLVAGCGQVERLQEALSRAGINTRNVLCYEADVQGFLDALQWEKLLELVDARYVLGDNHACAMFREALMGRIVQGKLLVDTTTPEGSIGEVGVLIREIADGVKILACRHGDTAPKPTWEKLEALGSQGIIPRELSGTLRETYIALRTIELRGRVCGDEVRADKNVHKKVVKTALGQIKRFKEIMMGPENG